MIIEDGTGQGYQAGVNSENRILTDSIAASPEHAANVAGNAYHMLFDQAPTAGDDCIIYIENSDEIPMIIEGLYLSVAGATELYFHLNDLGTRNGAGAVIPVNCNSGSGKTADGTFEVGLDLDGGAATLAGGVEIERYIFIAATGSAYFNFEQDIVLPKNATFTIWCSAIVAITGNVIFNYHGHE